MLEAFLINNVVFAILLWAILYTLDYYLTIYAARLYQAGANQHFGFGGSVELTPYYQKDVDRLTRLSPRFLLMLILSSALLFVLWTLAVLIAKLPALFSFALGAALLLEGVIHVRHFRNILLFQYARESKGIAGKIEYERWVTLRSSAVEFFSFAALYLFAFLISGRWFFAGGAIGSCSVGLRHWMWGNKAKQISQNAGDQSSPSQRGIQAKD